MEERNLQENKTHNVGNLIGTKVYFGGSQWIAIPHTERPYRKRNRAKDKPNENEAVVEFEQAFKETKGKRRKRRETLIKEFAPMFQNEQEVSEFVEEQFNRLSRNRWERYKRMIRRAYLQPWDYFVTFTFDSEKHTEETFRKQLMNCLYHLSNRKGWRYIGVWERGELGKRLHFHALMHIPQGAMVGELEEHNDYSTKRRKWEKSMQNSFFNERFGRSDFDAIVCSRSVSDSVNYMLKYLSKSDEKVVYSRGLKTYLVADILDEDILCPYHLDDENETKYILSPNFTCITDGEILGTVSPNIIAQMPKCN
jgi:predicted metallopeptidase